MRGIMSVVYLVYSFNFQRCNSFSKLSYINIHVFAQIHLGFWIMHPRFHLSILCIPMYYVYHMIGDAYESHAVSVLSILSILSVVSILSICSEHTIQMMQYGYWSILSLVGRHWLCLGTCSASFHIFGLSMSQYVWVRLHEKRWKEKTQKKVPHKVLFTFVEKDEERMKRHPHDSSALQSS